MMPMYAPTTVIDPAAARLDLDRFLAKLQDPHATRPLSEAEALAALHEYREFLTLRIENPNVELVPTPLADLAWHAHILDTEAYHRDCLQLFGHYLHHKPRFMDDDDHENALMDEYAALTASIWSERFGSAPSWDAHARCRGKACHAKTTCRCR